LTAPKIRLFVFLAILALPGLAQAQIAPECEGVEVPDDYDEARQQAGLSNFFGIQFYLSPMAPIVPYEGHKAGVGMEFAYVPSLSCEERLALGGTKTEDTDVSPIAPRPRITVQLPDLGPDGFKLASYVGVSLMPPIPLPVLNVSLMSIGTEMAVAWRSAFGLGIGARGHLSMGKLRAEIAKPLNPDDPAYDDVGFAWVMGGDLGLSYRFPWENFEWLTLYSNGGLADLSTLVIVGDDLVLVQNVDYPWWGPTVSLGAQTLWWEDHIEAGLELSSAVGVMTTVRAKVGLVW
jgi:hypothetical protein